MFDCAPNGRPLESEWKTLAGTLHDSLKAVAACRRPGPSPELASFSPVFAWWVNPCPGKPASLLPPCREHH